MKKYSLLIVAGALVSLASCNSDTGNAENAQRQIDSIVNAKVDAIRLELQMKNDSIINELAMWRADSIIAAQQGKKVATKPKPTVRRVDEGQMSTSSQATIDQNKMEPKGGVNDRPGASNSGGGVNDRPGASNSSGGVNDRPGAK